MRRANGKRVCDLPSCWQPWPCKTHGTLTAQTSPFFPGDIVTAIDVLGAPELRKGGMYTIRQVYPTLRVATLEQMRSTDAYRYDRFERIVNRSGMARTVVRDDDVHDPDWDDAPEE